MTDRTVEYVTKTTPDLGQEQIEWLKQIFPECVSDGEPKDRLRPSAFRDP